MIKLTRLSDYGIVLLSYMAKKPDKCHTAADLAMAANIPHPTVSKVLQLLLRQGLLQSTRGANGGYSLNCAPNSVSLHAIITALEGPVALTDCSRSQSNNSSGCEQNTCCDLYRGWREVNNLLANTLDSIYLSDLLDPASMPRVEIKRNKEQ
ncbi:MAG: SUF system Fe-S cluster assembly regulator [Mariprofundales bacterium]